MNHRYYSTQRPVSIMTFPMPEGNKVMEFRNFGQRKYCPEIDRPAWGYIDYENPLDGDQLLRYELVPEYCSYEVRLPAKSPTDEGALFGTSPIFEQAFHAAKKAKGAFYGIKQDGTKVLLL